MLTQLVGNPATVPAEQKIIWESLPPQEAHEEMERFLLLARNAPAMPRNPEVIAEIRDRGFALARYVDRNKDVSRLQREDACAALSAIFIDPITLSDGSTYPVDGAVHFWIDEYARQLGEYEGDWQAFGFDMMMCLNCFPGVPCVAAARTALAVAQAMESGARKRGILQ